MPPRTTLALPQIVTITRQAVSLCMSSLHLHFVDADLRHRGVCPTQAVSRSLAAHDYPDEVIEATLSRHSDVPLIVSTTDVAVYGSHTDSLFISGIVTGIAAPSNTLAQDP